MRIFTDYMTWRGRTRNRNRILNAMLFKKLIKAEHIFTVENYAVRVRDQSR